MESKKRSATGWSVCKAVIKNWPAAGLAELVHELYKLSPDNRRFLHARLLPEESAQTIKESRKALKNIISVSAIYNGKFRHADAKQIIDQYAKACDDPQALCDLLIGDLEIAFSTFHQVGDYEPIVDHLYATLGRLGKVSEKLSKESRKQFSPRLAELADKWGDKFGYGISDTLGDFVSGWLEIST